MPIGAHGFVGRRLIRAAAVIAIAMSTAVAGPVRAAGLGESAAPCGTRRPSSGQSFTDPSCPGVRPGAALLPETNQQAACTWGYLFHGSDGGTYSIMDGLCVVLGPNVSVRVFPPDTIRTWPRGKGPGIADGSGRVVGHVVWYSDTGSFRNALIRLDRGAHFDSSVCKYGAVHSIDRTISSVPSTVELYGQGDIGTGRKARPDVLMYGAYDPAEASLTQPSERGDTGAPVLSGDNQAFGLVSGHENSGTGPTHPEGGPQVYRLAPLMVRAGKAVRVTLTLLHGNSGTAL